MSPLDVCPPPRGSSPRRVPMTWVRQPSRWRALAGLCGVLVLAATACGGGGDDGGGDGGGASDDAPSGDQASASPEFCDGLVAFHVTLSGFNPTAIQSEADVVNAVRALEQPFAIVRENAPADLQDLVQQFQALMVDYSDGELAETKDRDPNGVYAQLVTEGADACDFEIVDVEATDFQLTGLPDLLDAGTVAFALSNESRSSGHEMVVLRKNDGVTATWDELLALPPAQRATQTTTALTILEVAPGGTGSGIAGLTPGEYLAFCGRPLGGTEAAGPPHHTQGMRHEFLVE